jgi:hypothetical protein
LKRRAKTRLRISFKDEFFKIEKVQGRRSGNHVVRDGAVVDAHSDDARVQGVRRFIEMIEYEPRLSATALQTVGSKGWDGFVLARVIS